MEKSFSSHLLKQMFLTKGDNMHSHTQVLVIGGGPAGSTAATLLAREGLSVTLIEREVFPRYHIGESLLPSCLEILELLDVREKVESHGFQEKHGGYFPGELKSGIWSLRNCVIPTLSRWFVLSLIIYS